MKLALMMWAAIFSGIVCLAQNPTAPAPAEPTSENPTVAVPNTPFESSSTPRPAGAVTPRANAPAVRPAEATATPASTGAASPGAGAISTAGDKPSKKPYVIGPLDVLDIRVWNDPKLSGLFDVRSDGVISMSLIGEIRADGLTVSELHDAIVAKLGELINAPEVNVQVARNNSKRYFIFGEVGRGGEFPLIAETTVLDALSNSGGFREFANPKKIYVLRGGQKLPFNYKDVSHGKHMEQNIVLENGDRIFVP